MADETVERNLQRMDELDFAGWNEADWEGVFYRGTGLQQLPADARRR